MKPIFFNTEMVEAILNYRKTVTRRKINIDITNNCDVDSDGALLSCEIDGEFVDPIKLCRYKVGDVLYVRETWCKLFELDHNDQIVDGTEKYYYKAGDSPPFERFLRNDGTFKDYPAWKPSIHMPKEAARIFLKVTDVRIERLQDISWEDTEKEGIWYTSPEFRNKVVIWRDSAFALRRLRIEYFAKYWNNILKKKNLHHYSWEANPWVWVIEFKRLEAGHDGR